MIATKRGYIKLLNKSFMAKCICKQSSPFNFVYGLINSITYFDKKKARICMKKGNLMRRCGLNKSSFEQISEKVYSEWISHSETFGWLNKWVTSLYFQNKTANNIKLYGDKAYLFHGNMLITVIQIPNNLLCLVKKVKREEK